MVQLINSEKQYDDALSRIYILMQKEIKEDSKDGAELEVLSLSVKNYETLHYPIPKPGGADWSDDLRDNAKIST